MNEELAAKQGKLEAAKQKEKFAVSNIEVLEDALEQTVFSYKALLEAPRTNSKAKSPNVTALPLAKNNRV